MEPYRKPELYDGRSVTTRNEQVHDEVLIALQIISHQLAELLVRIGVRV